MLPDVGEFTCSPSRSRTTHSAASPASTHTDGLENVSIAANVGYLSLFFFTFFALAYLALSFVRHQKR